MVKLFEAQSTDALEKPGDFIPGGVLETGLYNAIVKAAYVGKSTTSAAQSVTVMLEVEGREVRETFWVTNREGLNSYADKKDSKKRYPLPGFNSVDELCLVTTGFSLSDQEAEEKVLKLYDFDQRKEVPQTVPVLTGLTGKPVLVALVQTVVDKQSRSEAGEYVATGQTRTQTVMEKFMHAETRKTVTEIVNKADAEFADKWKARMKGQVRNKSTKGANQNAGTAGTPPTPGAGGGGTSGSIFS